MGEIQLARVHPDKHTYTVSKLIKSLLKHTYLSIDSEGILFASIEMFCVFCKNKETACALSSEIPKSCRVALLDVSFVIITPEKLII